jgi:DNA-directed RNA polymerase specialized sigma24 family protein
MSEVAQVAFVRAGMQIANRDLALTVRGRGRNRDAELALLVVHGEALFDFISLMVGPGEVAERVLADTTIAATSLVGGLRDDDLFHAWLFALARQECRRYPPVVWRERQWDGLRNLASRGPVGRRDAIPVEAVRMAVLGLAPSDREVLVLSSTRCKLLSGDVAAIFRASREEAVRSVAEAHRKFEEALAVCARTIGYQRDPRNRAPEIGELVGMVLSGIHRPLPTGRVLHVSRAPELAAYRRDVVARIRLNQLDGFPESWEPGALPSNLHRRRDERVLDTRPEPVAHAAYPRLPAPVGHRMPPPFDRRQLARSEGSRSADFVPG